jgi:ABC-type multidrug transport system ATPase subunit
MRPILTAESIWKSFGKAKVLSSAGLWATPGCVTALLGENGSGKTTLIKVAAGWLRPDEGVVTFKKYHSMSPRLASLAQLGLYFLPEWTILSPSVKLKRHFSAIKRFFPEARPEDAVSLLEIEELLDRKPKTFSTGERRRAMVAMALARRPTCLLADEPLRGIVPKDAQFLSKAFRALADDGCAVVIAGHEVRVMLEISDDVIWQVAGTTHHLGSPERAMEHEQFVREYFGKSPPPD